MIQKIKLSALLFSSILALTACKNEKNTTKESNQETTVSSQKDEHKIDTKLCIGSWKDTSEAALNFTLLADGTAKSDNMKTLLYKKWRVAGNNIIFTIESIGNHTSSTDDEVYEIIKLDDLEMKLKQGEVTYQYLRVVANK